MPRLDPASSSHSSSVRPSFQDART
jgi:hypothetical protein